MFQRRSPRARGRPDNDRAATGGAGPNPASPTDRCKVARAARLLGAQVILTGIGPDVARTLVALHSELRGIITLANLQSGIAHALASRGTNLARRG